MSQSPFGDIPLFRELQRLLASSGEGPVNLEIADQIAISLAASGGAERGPRHHARGRLLAEVVHEAETVLAGFARLPLTEPISSEAVTPAGWATKTLVGWRWLFERLGTRFLDATGGVDTTGGGDNQMQMVMKQVAPLLLGLQAGTLVGHLAREVTGGYDPSIPRTGERGIIVVVANLESLATDYALETDAVLRSAAIQEVARHLVVQAVPWVATYRKSLIEDLVDAIELDTGELQRRLIDLQAGGLEAAGEADVNTTMPLVATERHRQALDRVQGFVALHEGYAAHAVDATRSQLLGDSSSKVDEAMARQRASQSEARQMLADILGFSLSNDLIATGRTFCAAVAELEGTTALNHVWDAPDNLPSLAELRDPFLWIDRVVKER